MMVILKVDAYVCVKSWVGGLSEERKLEKCQAYFNCRPLEEGSHDGLDARNETSLKFLDIYYLRFSNL